MAEHSKRRLFVDMDGTLAEWRSFKYEFNSLEDVQDAGKLIYQKLNEDDYFYNLKPQMNVVNAIKEIVEHDPDIEVFILSAVISEKAEADKNRWLDRYLPEIDKEHRVFTEDGKDKKDFVKGGVRSDDYLLDDRTLNLSLWQPPARGIKLLNGINHSAGTWKNDMLNFEKSPEELSKDIAAIVKEERQIRDKVPHERTQTIEIKPITTNAFENADVWDEERKAVKEQYLNIIRDDNFRALEWETSLGGRYIFHRSTKDGDWQLSFIDHKGIPVSDSQYKDEDIGSGKPWTDPLSEFPHSRTDRAVTVRALFENPNSKGKENEMENEHLADNENSREVTHGEEKTFEYITAADVNAGWEKWNDNRNYGFDYDNEDKLSSVFSFEYRHKETGELAYSYHAFIKDSLKDYYDYHGGMITNAGTDFDAFEELTEAGYEATGRAVFRGYAEEYYDPWDKDIVLYEADIDEILKERGLKLKDAAEIDPSKSILDNTVESEKTFEYITVADTKTGWTDFYDNRNYGYIDGLLRGFNVEFRHKETGEITYNSANFVPGNLEDYYKERVDAWGDSGYEPFETETSKGFEPTGRAVFRGYAEEYYDEEERESFVREVDIDEVLKERGITLKSLNEIDVHKSILENATGTEILDLARDLDNAMYDYDVYEYADYGDTLRSEQKASLAREQNVATIANDLKRGGAGDYIEKLEDMIAYAEIAEDVTLYESLIERLKNLENGRGQEKTEREIEATMLFKKELIKQNGSPKEAKPEIKYFVAESMEFKNLGRVYTDIPTIEEALKIYKELPESARTMGNGIGAEIDDWEYPLFENGRACDLELFGGEYKDNEELKNAVKFLRNYAAFEKLREYEAKENPPEWYVERAEGNLEKFLNLGYDEDKAVYLARVNSRYINTDKMNISPQMPFNELTAAVNKEAGIVDLKDLYGMDYVVLDTETTGFGNDDEIIELGITDKDGNTLYEGMFKPNKEPSPQASAVNGIYMKDLLEKPGFGSEIQKIAEIVMDKPLVIYNRDFDTRLIMQSMEAHKEDIAGYEGLREQFEAKFKDTTYCAMQSYSAYKDSYRNTKLVDALEEQGVVKVQSHRAVDDCIDTTNLIKAVAEREMRIKDMEKEQKRTEEMDLAQEFYSFYNHSDKIPFAESFEKIKRNLANGEAMYYRDELLNVAEMESGTLSQKEADELYDFAYRLNREAEKDLDRTDIAVESTQDYHDLSFRRQAFGGGDRYRLVSGDGKGGIKPFTKEVFDSEEEARRAAESMENVRVLSYEALNDRVRDKTPQGIRDVDAKDIQKADLRVAMHLAGWEQWGAWGEATSWHEFNTDKAAGSQIKFAGLYDLQTYLETEQLNFPETSPFKTDPKAQERFFAVLNGKNEECVIDGHDCIKVDEWQDKSGTRYVLGREAGTDEEWYYAMVEENAEEFKGIYTQEYDQKPTREKIEERHVNTLAAEAIDRHEAEYGADGSRAFSNLNEEPPLAAAFNALADKAAADMTRQNSEWGSWFGRLAFNDSPQDYANIDITGYSTRNEIQCDISIVRDNKIVDNENFIIRTGREPFSAVINAASVKAKTDMESFCEKYSDSRAQTFYSNFPELSEQKIDVHYELLKNAGYEIFPETEPEAEQAAQQQEQTIKTNMGEMPVEDYLDIMAMQQGFDDYADMKAQGYSLPEEKLLNNESPAKILNSEEPTRQADVAALREVAEEQDVPTEAVYYINRHQGFGTGVRTWTDFMDKDFNVLESVRLKYTNAVKNLTRVAPVNENDLTWTVYQKGNVLNDLYCEVVDVNKENEKSSPREEEKEENMEEQRKELEERMNEGIKQTLDSEHFANWCKTQSKHYMKNYSFNNAFLVFMQQPNASYTCGFEAWKQYGRQVTKEAAGHGIKIYAPAFIENKNGKSGALYNSIKSNCAAQLKNNPEKEYATYRLGASALVVNMYKNNLFDVSVNGKAALSHAPAETLRKFLDQSVIGKVATGYRAVTVFDVSYTTDKTEFLWVNKNACKKSEMVLDKNGKPVTRGNMVKIRNSEERRNLFKPDFGTELKEADTDKMQILYETLQKVSADKGVPVREESPANNSELAGGALGYYQHTTPEYPNGNIVVSSDLSLTNKVSVLFHEMAHSDMHKDLDKLKAEMGDVDDITRNMKETQAEAVALMSASTFGIETETKSFEYIAAWTANRDLKDLKQSMEVIFKESKSLLNSIEKELDAKGFTMALTAKDKTPLSAEEKKAIVAEYKAFVVNTMRENETVQKAALSEFKALSDGEEKTIVKEQVALIHEAEEKIAAINGLAEQLEAAEDKDTQTELIYKLKAQRAQVENTLNKISDLSEERVDVAKGNADEKKADFKKLYAEKPLDALKKLQKEVPAMKDLSKDDLKFLAHSKFIKENYGKYLGSDNEKFAALSLKQLENFKEALSKNRTAVEVSFCEQWGDTPIFEQGTIANPKAANKIIEQAETQIRGFKAAAEKADDYYPYSKCYLTVYSFNDKGNLVAFDTRLDIGDGSQKNLTDHISQFCGSYKQAQNVFENFDKSTRERSAAKILTPGTEKETVEKAETGRSMKEWKEAAKGKSGSREIKEKETEKDAKKDSHEKE